MRLSFIRMVLGPLQNNVYLLGDEDSQDAVLIDPSFEVEKALEEARRQGWTLRQIWLTHAHYDHLAGAARASTAFFPPLPIAMHVDAETWIHTQGQVVKFGLVIEAPVPSLYLIHGQRLSLNPESQEAVIEVRLAPGHSPGSVIFYCEKLGVAFCGDVIFKQSIGRTDLQGGDYDALIESIHSQVLSLPESTTLLPGHGTESSVAYEMLNNPYLA